MSSGATYVVGSCRWIEGEVNCHYQHFSKSETLFHLVVVGLHQEGTDDLVCLCEHGGHNGLALGELVVHLESSGGVSEIPF